VDVGESQAGQFGDAQAGLDRELQHRAVTSADPGARVGRGEQRLDFALVEVGDQSPVVAFRWDREDAGDRRGVFGVAEAGELVEGVDRSEAGVAGTDCVLALVFEMIEERGD
jgi:hypothetical protein